MTGYQAPPEQQWAADVNRLFQRVAVLQRQAERFINGVTAVTSTTHPANPATGQPIYETDTGLEARWSGLAWVYPPQKIAEQVLTGSTASVTFSSLPQAFTSFRVIWSGRSDNASGATYMCVRFNNDSSNSYLWQINQANNNSLTGSGNSGGTVGQIQIGTIAAATATSGYFGSGEFTIPNATGSQYKAPTGYSTSMNATNNGYAGAYGGLWLNTAAITSITLLPLNGNLVTGSSMALYGM